MKPARKKAPIAKKPGLSGYAPFLGAVKNRIRAAQVKAALSANAELIHLYWDIGRAIAAMQEKERWGAGVIPRLARDLANDLPEVKGFSERNLKYMVRFAREYGPPPIVQQPAAQLGEPANGPAAPAQSPPSGILQQAVAKSPGSKGLPTPSGTLAGSEQMAIVQQLAAQLPWFHHVLLMEKVKDLGARLWYMRQTITHG